MEKNSMIRMKDFPITCEENCPDSLFDIAIKFCIDYPHALFIYNGYTRKHEPRNGISLHPEICHRMLELSSLEQRATSVQKLIHFFKDTTRTRLTKINLNYSEVTDEEIEILCKHPIRDLHLYGCLKMTPASLFHINKLKSLISLDVGNTALSAPEYLSQPPQFKGARKELVWRNYIRLMKLRRLGLEKSIGLPQCVDFEVFVFDMSNLTHIDLSRFDNVEELSCLADKKHMVSLILFNVRNVQQCFPIIQSLTSLKHLDISSDPCVYFDNPDQLLKSLVDSLENLESLDISGTNLAGKLTSPLGDTIHDPAFLGSRLREARENHRPTEFEVTDIPGLISRIGRPLEYLGLYETAFDACYRRHIPAKRIGGEANEDQILMAAQMHVTRAEVIHKMFKHLLNIFQYSICTNIPLVLDIVFHTMRIHSTEKHIQLSGGILLSYIVACKETAHLDFKTKRNILKLLFNIMSENMDDTRVMKLGCLSLVNFTIPDDVLFDFERLIYLLLRIVSTSESDEYVQRVSLVLLNIMVWKGDNGKKLLVCDAGAVIIMLQVIKSRLDRGICDDVMEIAWGLIWSVTDETRKNCKTFVDKDGMSLFLGCMKTFPEKPELLKNMLGLLVNFAEIKELRPFLMKNEYVLAFTELLSSQSGGIQVSYNAAGILSHIASDDPELLEQRGLLTPVKQAGLDEMVKTILSWDSDAKWNINFWSLDGILRLLNMDHAPEAQLWAVWALANLIRMCPEKYCTLLKEESIKILLKLNSHPMRHIQKIAAAILAQCEKYRNT